MNSARTIRITRSRWPSLRQLVLREKVSRNQRRDFNLPLERVLEIGHTVREVRGEDLLDQDRLGAHEHEHQVLVVIVDVLRKAAVKEKGNSNAAEAVVNPLFEVGRQAARNQVLSLP